MTKPTKPHGWIFMLGVILLLLGIYATVRTAINLLTLEKYPTTGVISLNIFGSAPYYPREQDCFYPPMNYGPDGKRVEQTDEEKEAWKKQQQFCLEGVKETRENTKISDISQSILFLFLGVGILYTYKKYLI